MDPAEGAAEPGTVALRQLLRGSASTSGGALLAPTRFLSALGTVALRHLCGSASISGGARLARRALHLRHVWRRVRPDLHGRRARRHVQRRARPTLHRRRACRRCPGHARFEAGEVDSMTGLAVWSI